MTPEGRVKTMVKNVLARYEPIWYFMPVSGGYGKHGIGDYVCCVAGNFLVIECKAGKNTLTALQDATRGKILDTGGHYMVVNEENILELAYALVRLGATKK